MDRLTVHHVAAIVVGRPNPLNGYETTITLRRIDGEGRPLSITVFGVGPIPVLLSSHRHPDIEGEGSEERPLTGGTP